MERYQVVCNKTGETLLLTDHLGEAHGAAGLSEHGAAINDRVGEDGGHEPATAHSGAAKLYALSEVALEQIESALDQPRSAYARSLARGYVIAARKNRPITRERMI